LLGEKLFRTSDAISKRKMSLLVPSKKRKENEEEVIG